MIIYKNRINDTQVELEVVLEPQDIRPHLEHAARHLSQHQNIPGFRPGKAPYEIVKRHVGEDKIFKEALDDMINASLAKAISQENLNVMDESDFKAKDLNKDKVSYTITLTLLPEVKLNDWTARKIKRKQVEVADSEVENSMNELAKMLVRENKVDREAKLGDSALIDFEVFVDGKVIEGGTGKNFTVIIGDKKMIPGFEEALVGHKANDEFLFDVKFPDDYATHLAGKDAQIKIKVHQVLERAFPPINDDMAKRLGEKDRASLVERLKQNLKLDKESKETQAMEVEAVKQVVDTATIGPIPDKAVDAELESILAEFEQDLKSQGVVLDVYFKQTGKSLDEIKKEFRPKALERVKTALVLNQIIDENKIEVSEDEIDREVMHHKSHFKDNPQAQKDIEHPNYRRHLKNRLFNRKAVKLIVEKLVE